MEVQTAEPLLQARTVVPVTSQTSPHHTIRKVPKKECSEVTIEKCRKCQNLFRLLQIKKLGLHIMLKLFHFVKINHNDNKSDANLKTSQLGKGGEFENL
jgi:hypothetical protein